MTSNLFPSIADTKYSLLSEIEKSMREQYEIENSKPKNQKEKIRLSRRKKNTDFIQLNQSVVLNELHKLYFLGGNFRSDIFKQTLENDQYFENPTNKKTPISSGYIWRAHQDDSEIAKYKDSFKGYEIKELEVALLLWELKSMAEEADLPKLQQVIDHAQSKATEEEKRKTFNGTLNTNLKRHVMHWTEKRENASKELLHHSFRERLKATIESLNWIKEKDSIYSSSKSKIYIEKDDIDYEKNIGYIAHKMKRFNDEIKGYTEGELTSRQDLTDNTERRVNAPQIFSTKTLKEKILPFFFKEQGLFLSMQNIYDILDRYLNNFIQGVSDVVRDEYVNDEGETLLYSENVDFIRNEDPHLQVIREDIVSKIQEMGDNKYIVYAFVVSYFIKNQIKEEKERLNSQLDSQEVKKYAFILSDNQNNYNFSPIKISMRVNKIDEYIQEEIVSGYFQVEETMDSLLKNAKEIIESILSDYEEGEDKEQAENAVMDIIVESFTQNVEWKIEKVSA